MTPSMQIQHINGAMNAWDSPKEVDKRKTLVHNMEEDLNDA
jgi:hypothetical protein